MPTFANIIGWFLAVFDDLAERQYCSFSIHVDEWKTLVHHAYTILLRNSCLEYQTTSQRLDYSQLHVFIEVYITLLKFVNIIFLWETSNVCNLFITSLHISHCIDLTGHPPSYSSSFYGHSAYLWYVKSVIYWCCGFLLYILSLLGQYHPYSHAIDVANVPNSLLF